MLFTNILLVATGVFFLYVMYKDNNWGNWFWWIHVVGCFGLVAGFYLGLIPASWLVNSL